MFKTAGFFLLWLTGSAAAVAVAWTGVSIVDDELIDPAPAFDQVAAGASGTIPLDPTNLSQVSTSSSSATTVADLIATSTLDRAEPTVAQPATDTSTTAAQPAMTPPGNSTETDASSTTTRAPTTTSVPSPTTAPATTTAPPAVTLTFNLVGGSTAISFSAAGVDVLWATPNPGFTVQIAPESPGIKVEFEADDHESRIDAWWAGGPQHEIREKPDG